MNYAQSTYQESQRQLSLVPDYVDGKMFDYEDEIRNWIRTRWLKGLKPDGTNIGFYRDPHYSFFKAGLNPQAGTGVVDLTLTGALGRNIQLSGFNLEYEIFSSDAKFAKIRDKYGAENFNLTKDQERELFDKVMAEVISEMVKNIY